MVWRYRTMVVVKLQRGLLALFGFINVGDVHAVGL
jgi:hypothetical protein